MRFKSNVFKFIWRAITIKYLIQRQYEAAKLQKPLQAVFANDTIGSFINVDGVFEKYQLEVLTDFLNRMNFSFNNKHCIDVGANIGNHSLYFSDLFSRVTSFEAHPKVFKLLEFFCELLTMFGNSVRRKEEFIGCKICGDAIPSQKIYNKLAEKNIPVPNCWMIKCKNC